MSKDPNDPTAPTPANVGGQAVLEGVMMRAPGSLAIVCRRRDGSIVLRERTLPFATQGPTTWPFLRGMLTLFSSLKIGHQALRWSADLLAEDEAAKEAADKNGTKPAMSKAPPPLSTLTALAIVQACLLTGNEAPGQSGDGATSDKKTSSLLTIIPIVFAIGLFILAPQLAAEGLNSVFGLGLEVQSAPYQMITGLSKIAIVVSYMALIRLSHDIKRVFQYHGAEHKAISTYEAQRPLLVEEAQKTSALHARCGTTFIIMVAFVSVVIFSAVGAFLPPIGGGRAVQSLVFFVLKLPLLPVIAGITYELQRFFAKYCATGPLRVLLWPGFLVQKITTAPPDDAQLEIALASLRSALARAKSELPKTHPDQSYASYQDLIDAPAYRELAMAAKAQPASA